MKKVPTKILFFAKSCLRLFAISTPLFFAYAIFSYKVSFEKALLWSIVGGLKFTFVAMLGIIIITTLINVVVVVWLKLRKKS